MMIEEEVSYFEDAKIELDDEEVTDEGEVTEELLIEAGIDPVPAELRGAEEE